MPYNVYGSQRPFLFVLYVGIKKHGHTADFPYYFVLTKFNAKHLVCLFVDAIIAGEEHFYNAIGIPPLMRFYWWGGGGGETFCEGFNLH